MSRSVARCIALLLVALAATVAFAGCGGGGSSSLGTGIVANVNGVEISQTELDEVVSQATDRLEAQGQKLPAAGSEQYQAIQQDALQYLVKKIQLEQQAKELGVTVTDKQVDERLQSAIKQFFGGEREEVPAVAQEAEAHRRTRARGASLVAARRRDLQEGQLVGEGVGRGDRGLLPHARRRLPAEGIAADRAHPRQVKGARRTRSTGSSRTAGTSRSSRRSTRSTARSRSAGR